MTVSRERLAEVFSEVAHTALTADDMSEVRVLGDMAGQALGAETIDLERLRLYGASLIPSKIEDPLVRGYQAALCDILATVLMENQRIKREADIRRRANAPEWRMLLQDFLAAGGLKKVEDFPGDPAKVRRILSALQRADLVEAWPPVGNPQSPEQKMAQMRIRLTVTGREIAREQEAVTPATVLALEKTLNPL